MVMKDCNFYCCEANGRNKLIEYDDEYGCWVFKETEYGLIVSTIKYCPYCGSKLR